MSLSAWALVSELPSEPVLELPEPVLELPEPVSEVASSFAKPH